MHPACAVRPIPANDPPATGRLAGASGHALEAGVNEHRAEPVPDDTFELYDLRVEVIATDRPMVCGHRVGDWFEVHGESLIFPPQQPFSMYALAALLPLLPARQRETHPHDWMTTDTDIACPDPHCGARFRISRLGLRRFSHREVSAVPLPSR